QVVSSSGGGVGTGDAINVSELARDPATGNVYALSVATGAKRVYRITPANGARTLISDLENATQGPVLANGSAMAVYDGSRVLVANGSDKAVLAVNPASGARWTISGR